MRRVMLTLAGLLVLAAAPGARAQTADEIVARYVKTIGGMERLAAIKSLRRTGKYTGGGGFEAVVIDENRRPGMVRSEFSLQGMTGVYAYDGRTGWKIEPWNGKKDAESLGEEELRGIVEDSDIDGPLINYKEKGHRLEYMGLEPVEGTDAHKLRLTLKNGDVSHYFMDTDYFVPIKVERKRMIRGAERESETTLGDYKEVAGVYLPHFYENAQKGSPNKSQVTYAKIEANVALDESRFRKPGATGESPTAPDASETQPKPPADQKPPAEGPKPPANKPQH